MRLEQPKSSYSAYVKAGLVFVASTAAFLLAKTTGFLPDWRRWGSEESTELTVGDSSESLLTPMSPEPVAEQTEFFSTASTTDLSSTPLLTDFQEQSLPPILLDSQSEGVIEQGDEIIIDTSVVKAAQRRLLQTPSPVTVQAPIPNQVIDASQQYSYSLNSVFSPGYFALSAGTLPSWLSLQYGFTGSLNPGSAWDVAIQSHYAFVAANSGGLVVDGCQQSCSNPTSVAELSVAGYALCDDSRFIGGGGSQSIMPGSVKIVNISNP